MRSVPLLLLTAACLVTSASLAAQAGSAQPPRLLCPEYAEPTAYAGGPAAEPKLLGRDLFRPRFESPTAEGERLAQAVDDLFREAWDAGLIQPRELLNELAVSILVDVHDVRNRVEGDPWAERVTAGQVARVEHHLARLQAFARGALPAEGVLRELRFPSLRVLLSCPATFRDRRVLVSGGVRWERSPHPPHDVVALHLYDDGLQVRLHWAGRGPVAEAAPGVFERHEAVGSWWKVSLGQVNGAQAVLLHDFLGNNELGDGEPAQLP